jgi:ABC-type antimicrobial peptide transport system permease subunit
MALGAQRSHVLGLVMRESMILVVIGIVVGLVAAVSASGFVKALLFGLPPTDPLALAAAIGIMIVVSGLAGYLPARRASKVDPMVALHYE